MNNSKTYTTILASQWETMKDNLTPEQTVMMIDAFFATMNGETPDIEDDKVKLLYSAWEYGLKQQAKRRSIAKQQGDQGIKGKEYGILGAAHGAKGGRPRKGETREEYQARKMQVNTIQDAEIVEETTTNEKNATDLLLPIISYNYHTKGDNFNFVKANLNENLTSNPYFRHKCQEIKSKPIPANIDWVARAANYRAQHEQGDMFTTAAEEVLKNSDNRQLYNIYRTSAGIAITA